MIKTPPERKNLPRKNTVLGPFSIAVATFLTSVKGATYIRCSQNDSSTSVSITSQYHSSILKAAVNLLMVNCATAPNITMLR